MTTPEVKNVLFVVTGESPAVVTETLFGLWRDLKVTEGELQVLTTSDCESKMRKVLPEKVDAFNQAYKTNWWMADGDGLFVVGEDADQPLNDITTDEEQKIAANDILDRIRAIRAESNEAQEVVLHASLAGGRKTMGVYLYQSLCWFGGPRDTLSHVALDDEFSASQEEWESEHGKFYYPEVVEYNATQPVPDREQAGFFHFSLIPFVRLPFTSQSSLLPAIFRRFIVVEGMSRYEQSPRLSADMLRWVDKPTFHETVQLSRLLLADSVKLLLFPVERMKDIRSGCLRSYDKNHPLPSQLNLRAALAISDIDDGFTILVPLTGTSAAWYYFLVKYANKHLNNNIEIDLTKSRYYNDTYRISCLDTTSNFSYDDYSYEYRGLISESYHALGVTKDRDDPAISLLVDSDDENWPEEWKNSMGKREVEQKKTGNKTMKTFKELRLSAIQNSLDKLRKDMEEHFGKRFKPSFLPSREIRKHISICVNPVNFCLTVTNQEAADSF